jgi:hypothetical protein
MHGNRKVGDGTDGSKVIGGTEFWVLQGNRYWRSASKQILEPLMLGVLLLGASG